MPAFITSAVDVLSSVALTLSGLSFVTTAVIGCFAVLMFVVALTQLELLMGDDDPAGRN